MTLVIDAARDLKHLPDRPCKDKALHTKLISGEAWKRTEKCLKNVRCRLSAHFLREEHEKALTKVSQLEKQLVQKDKVFEQVLKREGKVFNVALQAKEQECSLKLQANEQQFRQELPAKEHDLVEWRVRPTSVQLGTYSTAQASASCSVLVGGLSTCEVTCPSVPVSRCVPTGCAWPHGAHR